VRTVLLWVALASMAGLLFLTIDVARTSGITPIVVLSALVLALFGFGIVGALLHPPDE
jgi:hypothetical protein